MVGLHHRPGQPARHPPAVLDVSTVDFGGVADFEFLACHAWCSTFLGSAQNAISVSFPETCVAAAL